MQIQGSLPWTWKIPSHLTGRQFPYRRAFLTPFDIRDLLYDSWVIPIAPKRNYVNVFYLCFTRKLYPSKQANTFSCSILLSRYIFLIFRQKIVFSGNTKCRVILSPRYRILLYSNTIPSAFLMIYDVVGNLPETRACSCGHALDHALLEKKL